MRIALIVTRVNSYLGAPHYVASLARALAVEHDVTVFSTEFRGLDGQSVKHRQVKGFGTGTLFDRTFSLDSAAKLREARLSGSENFDVVNSHHYGTAFVSNVVTSHYCEQEGVRRMRFNAPGLGSELTGEKLLSLAKAQIENALFGPMTTTNLIVLSEAMKREFIGHHQTPFHRIFVVHSGVDQTRFSPANVPLYRDVTRRRHSLDPNEPVVLFVGADWERKGLAQAIEALSRLRKREAKLLVLGRGEVRMYRKIAVERGVGDRVIFAGRRESQEYYAAADVFLLPTQYEAFGLSILEAMATGLPVVVSRSAGASELLRDGHDALLLDDPLSGLEAAAKLELLLSRQELRHQLGRRARETALQHSWSGVAKRTAEVYRTILHQRSQDLSEAAAPAA